MEETKEIKKMKMLAMRKLVQDHVVGGKKNNIQHLGQLDLDKADNTRLVISLQDLADKLLGKKRRAESYIAHLRQVIEAYGGAIAEYGGEIVQLRQRLKSAQGQIEDQNQQLISQADDISKLHRQLSVFKEMYIDGQPRAISARPVLVNEEAPTKAEPAGPNPFYRKFSERQGL